MADLDVTVTDAAGTMAVHIGGDTSVGDRVLLIDVDDPVRLWRATGHGASLRRRLPKDLPLGVVLRVRSAGKNLGDLTVASGRRLRGRPTAAGLLVVARIAVHAVIEGTANRVSKVRGGRQRA